jgi:hypothetical protein
MMVNPIRKLLRESLNNNEIWYHGTPDVRSLEKEGGFTSKTMSVDYITDMKQYRQLQANLETARIEGNEDDYFRYLDMVPKLKDRFTFRKPIFLTNDVAVARTYADAKRSPDYQNAMEKVLRVKVSGGKSVTIIATGDRFRFISYDKVKRGFINAGISEERYDEVASKILWYQQSKDGIRTDSVAVIGEWFEFDYLDVVGVLDSYHGGSVKSTVRMVYDPKSITIIK